ncbi:hypothetical protein [Virgisporangium aliadipatigenens]|nr:hypothetical protein [Virgisporangium aliadipatigenens]
MPNLRGLNAAAEILRGRRITTTVRIVWAAGVIGMRGWRRIP